MRQGIGLRPLQTVCIFDILMSMKAFPSKERQILVVMPGAAISNWRKLEGIMSYARTRPDWTVELLTTDDERVVRKALAARPPDGIVCGTVRLPILRRLLRERVPTVILCFPDSRHFGKCEHALFIESDGDEIVRRSVEFLLARGYRSFAYLWRDHSAWDADRHTAFTARVAKEGLPVVSVESSDPVRTLLRNLKRLPERCAVLAADDTVAFKVLNLCRHHGIPVPNRFAVMGVSNGRFLCENARPTLTSVDQDFERGGFLAAQRLNAVLNGGVFLKTSHYPPAGIVERESTPALRDVHSLVVERALEFIRRKCDEPIEVPDVVREAAVSRRRLELLFRRELGTSVAARVREIRLDRLAELMKTSSLPFARICAEHGWENESHAKRLFKARFGCTMSAYRADHSAAN